MYAVQLAFSAHRERLAELAAQGQVLAAGPWSEDSGALLVFLTTSRAELDEILAGDPYYSAPGVEVVAVHEWNPVTRHPALAGL